MLVLSRKRFEMIQVGEDVVIKVLETGSQGVKIGIEAPDNIRILRAELLGTPGPGHPLTDFLRERRQIKQGKRPWRIGNLPGLSGMLDGVAPGEESAGGV